MKSESSKRSKANLDAPPDPWRFGKIDDLETEITADLTWLSALPANEYPRLKPPKPCYFEVHLQGATRLQVMTLVGGPKVLKPYLQGPHQAVLEPWAWSGNAVRIGKMPVRNGKRTVIRTESGQPETPIQVRKCIVNGARWIEIDRPLEITGPDLVASFGDVRFGR